MSKKILIPLKTILFMIFLYIACLITSFFVRDDNESYTKFLFRDFYSQKNIDVLFCGASHVSHGLHPEIMDKRMGKVTFNTGTPSQRIDGTLAIIKEAVSLYDIKEIWLEMDFAVSNISFDFTKSSPGTETFLISSNLRNFNNKFNYIKNSTSPKYYLNSLCPIGIESLVDLNPINIIKRTINKIKAIFIPNNNIGKNRSYGGKGIVLDHDIIENGTFTSGIEHPISIPGFNNFYADYIRSIIAFCEEHNIKLNFYCQPQTDFYLCEKGNYDEFHNYITDLISPYTLIDFNFVKPEMLSFEDEDFFDDNHFNERGIEKFTDFFCNYYNGIYGEEIFCSSYNEKLQMQESKVLGLMIDTVNNSTINIIPVLNKGSTDAVSYEINLPPEHGIVNRKEDGSLSICLNKNVAGTINIRTLYDGKLNHCIEKNYFSF